MDIVVDFDCTLDLCNKLFGVPPGIPLGPRIDDFSGISNNATILVALNKLACALGNEVGNMDQTSSTLLLEDCLPFTEPKANFIKSVKATLIVKICNNTLQSRGNLGLDNFEIPQPSLKTLDTHQAPVAPFSRCHRPQLHLLGFRNSNAANASSPPTSPSSRLLSSQPTTGTCSYTRALYDSQYSIVAPDASAAANFPIKHARSQPLSPKTSISFTFSSVVVKFTLTLKLYQIINTLSVDPAPFLSTLADSASARTPSHFNMREPPRFVPSYWHTYL
ncbi:hypothetical protein C8R46DRAFT_1213721 [Mycena filopes]|nr:hypothetical protein C8R46DRAFT_1213721 [Mycena filopes]